MSATEILRANLTAAGIAYGKLGDYTTRVSNNGMSYTVDDCYDGELNVRIPRLTPDEVMGLMRRTVPKRYIYYGDGVGHSECTACGDVIVAGYEYCPWCGVRFEGIESEVR